MDNDFFNNRELALIIWVFLLLLWAFGKTEIRKSLIDLFHAFFAGALIRVVLLIWAYFCILVYALYIVDLWDASLAKKTVIWIVAVAIVTCFKIDQLRENPHFFRDKLLANFKLAVVLEFILSFYSYSLWVELIMVPFLTIVTIMQVVAGREEKTKIVENLMTWILVLWGSLVLYDTVLKVFSDYQNIATLRTVFDFLFPIVMMLLFIPFLYIFRMYVIYETAFVKINIFIPENLRKFAKYQAIKHFNVNIFLLDRWAHRIPNFDKFSEAGILKSINLYKKLQRKEEKPPFIHENDGWAPNYAGYYLSEYGLGTGEYNISYENEWGASSSLVDVGEAPFKNNIAYYIEGNFYAVRVLKLKININAREEEKLIKELLVSMAEVLCLRALRSDLPLSIKRAILSGKSNKINIGQRVISVKRTNWLNKRNGGYDLIFQIKYPQPIESV